MEFMVKKKLKIPFDWVISNISLRTRTVPKSSISLALFLGCVCVISRSNKFGSSS